MKKKRIGRYSYSVALHEGQSSKKEKIIHFGSVLRFRDSERYMISRERYIHGNSHKSSFNKYQTYSDEEYNCYCEKALQNYDINMCRFANILEEDFELFLDTLITKIRNEGYPIIEITDLNDINYCGVYFMILGKYKQIYFGASQNMSTRIKQHWQKTKPIDRLVFGGVENSKISIDCFKALDTTRIFAIKTVSADEAFKLEGIIDKWMDEKYVLNRVWGGRPSDMLEAISKMLVGREHIANKPNSDKVKNNL